MASALIDSTIVLRLLTAQLETAVADQAMSQLGEAPHAASGYTIRVISLAVTRDIRSHSDGQPNLGTFELMVEVTVDSENTEIAIDTITKKSMKVVAALSEQRLYDASTTHEIVTECPEEQIATADAPDERTIGVSLITVGGTVRRDSGATVAS